MIRTTNLELDRDGNSLLIRREPSTTRIEFVPPAGAPSPDSPMSVAVEIKTEIPETLREFCARPGAITAINRSASLGALTIDDGHWFLGSRLTIYEVERAWQMQASILFVAACDGLTPLVGALRESLDQEPRTHGRSQWTESEMVQLEAQLLKTCVCTGGRGGIAAEFGLVPGAVSAASGDTTALWQLSSETPHPYLGGGLLGILRLPYPFHDEEKLSRTEQLLNRLEMQPHDLPPHFGAWCSDTAVDGLVYVTFLPNLLHEVPAIEVAVSFWAKQRAKWAWSILDSLGSIL
jgi:hypothetical protein